MFGVTGDRLGHATLLLGMRAIYAVLAATLMAFAFAGARHAGDRADHRGADGAGPSLRSRRAQRADRRNHAGRPADQRDEHVAHHDRTRRASPARSRAPALFAVFGMAPAYVFIVSFYVLGALLIARRYAPPSRHISLALTPEELRANRPGATSRKASRTPGTRRSCSRWSRSPSWPTCRRFRLPTACCLTWRKDVYRVDQTGLGYLVASFAAGALIGSIALSRVSAGVRLTRLMIVATVALVRDAAGVRADAGRAAAVPRADAGRRRAELRMVSLRSCCCANAGETLPRPRDGRAHDGDLQPAARIAGRRRR